MLIESRSTLDDFARQSLVAGRSASYDECMATTSSVPLTLRRLEDHLWQAADLFRNKVSNQKDYILALLFFKRASDLYAEELEAAFEEVGDVPNAEELARDPAFHVLQVPADTRGTTSGTPTRHCRGKP
jgi:hypothetical protein